MRRKTKLVTDKRQREREKQIIYVRENLWRRYEDFSIVNFCLLNFRSKFFFWENYLAASEVLIRRSSKLKDVNFKAP